MIKAIQQFQSFSRMLLVCVTCVLQLGLSLEVNADSSDKGLALLKQMSSAASELNYQGEFVVVKGGQISSMKIIHSVTDEGSQQKLMSLSGSLREIIQSGDEVACVLPDQGVGVREKRQLKQPFAINVSSDSNDILKYYSVNYSGQARVASRDCDQVNVTPKDTYRYGYLLCIDTETQLLLKSDLTDSSGEVLESYMFVAIEFGDVAHDSMQSQTQAQTLNWINDSEPSGASEMVTSAPKWRIADNETGFELQQTIHRISPLMKVGVTHMILGDGLANVSVFVSSADASANKQKEAMSMGGLNSYSREIDDHMVTVIGEVPQDTVAMLAEHTERIEVSN